MTLHQNEEIFERKAESTFRYLVISILQFYIFIFGRLKIQQTSKGGGGDPYKMYDINVVQSCWNFAQVKEIKK